MRSERKRERGEGERRTPRAGQRREPRRRKQKEKKEEQNATRSRREASFFASKNLRRENKSKLFTDSSPFQGSPFPSSPSPLSPSPLALPLRQRLPLADAHTRLKPSARSSLSLSLSLTVAEEHLSSLSPRKKLEMSAVALQQENVAPAAEVEREEMECGPMPIEKLQVCSLAGDGRVEIGSEKGGERGGRKLREQESEAKAIQFWSERGKRAKHLHWRVWGEGGLSLALSPHEGAMGISLVAPSSRSG